jgi:hypothetical protein
MLKTTAFDIDQARFNATADTQMFLRQHEASLCDLLDALEDPRGFSALYDLKTAFGQPLPDPAAVETALGAIHHALADQAPSSLDRIGHTRNLPASEMTLWLGARVSEMLARFRRAA